jgi:hypothetical protein
MQDPAGLVFMAKLFGEGVVSVSRLVVSFGECLAA